MFIARHLPIFLALLLLGGFTATANAQRPYTVEDMLRTEGIGKILFDPGGRYVVFERHGPFNAQPDFGRPFVPGQLRSRLFRFDLQGGGAPTPLFDQPKGSSYTLLSISPDGSHVAFLRVSDSGMAAGVHNLERRRQHEFRFPVGRFISAASAWISNHQLAFPAAAPGDLPDFFSIHAERMDQMTARWEQARAGREPTASPLGSGRFESSAAVEGSLVLADTARSDVRTLATGNFSVLAPSPDGRVLAALKNIRLVLRPNEPVAQVNFGGVQRELIVRHPAGRGAKSVCGGCDVAPTSLRWSPNGRYLAFYARGPGQKWGDASFRIYDAQAGTLRAASLGNVKPHVISGIAQMNVGAVWLGETLVVRGREPPAETGAPEAPVHWFRLGPSQPVNLTAEFATTRTEIISTSQDSLIVLAAGEAWALDAHGRRTNLTAGVAAPVGIFRPNHHGGTSPDLRPSESIVLDSRAAGPNSPRQLIFLDPGTGTVTTIEAPSPTATVLAASATSRHTAFLDQASNAGVLVVAGQHGSQRIAEINRHLVGVAGGTPVRIDHKGPDGSDRMSWLLLPPGHRKGERLPTIVNIHPGSGNMASWTRWRMDSTTPLNDHILAGRGFAILYPSNPAGPGVPREPLPGITESVLAAVDAAIAQGYVDPDRLAIQGQSFGGFAAAAVISQTGRFKAAVAQAGLYNLASLYGQFDPKRRLSFEHEGLNLYMVAVLETGHGGMQAPPWRDAQRYLRNSPLTHVEAVKTPIMLIHGDLDYVPISQSEEYFTALKRLDKDAVFLRYFGEDHVFNSPANIRDMWSRIFNWYEQHLGPPGGTD